MGVLRELHPKAGDLATVWDVNDPATVEAAIEEFERQMRQGKRGYADLGKGDEVIGEFCPEAAEIIVITPFEAA